MPSASPTPNDRQFEKTFSDIAMSALMDRAPALLDYLVGFQVLDANEDQSQAVGVFGCKINDQWIYVPAFFMNGELKGSEMLYLKDQDLFLPATDGWISYLLRLKPKKLGESSDMRLPDIGRTSSPNLTSFTDSPFKFACEKAASVIASGKPTKPEFYSLCNGSRGFKSASFHVPGWSCENVQPWAANAIKALTPPLDQPIASEALPAAVTKMASVALGAAQKSPFIEFLKQAGARVTSRVVGRMLKHADIGNLVLKFHPVGEITGLTFNAEKSAAANDENPVVSPSQVASNLHGVSQAKVKILSAADKGGWDFFGLKDEEKGKLLTGGVLVRDGRTSTSTLFWRTAEQLTTTIARTGVYDYISNTGDPVRAFIAVNPLCVTKHDLSYVGGSGSGSGSRYYSKPAAKCTIINMDGNGVGEFTAAEIYGREVETGLEHYATFFDNFKPAASMEVGSVYALISGKSNATKPFRVLKKVTRPDNSILYAITDRLRVRNNEDDNDSLDCATQLIISDRTGELKKLDETILAPVDSKVIKISLAGTDRYWDYSFGLPKPATPAMIDELLWSRGHAVPMKVFSNGSEFEVTVGSMKSAGFVPARQALEQLIFNHGIKGDDALELIKQATADAAHKKACKVLISYTEGYPNFTKQANPFLGAGMVGDPGIPIRQMGSDSWSGVPYSEPQQDRMRVPTIMNPGLADQTYRASILGGPQYSPMGQGGNAATGNVMGGMEGMGQGGAMDENSPFKDQEALQQAAATGQQDVFDTAMLGSLVKDMDTSRMIDRYLGDMILGMDRIGRIYFMFLQHNEDFAERYGQDDLTEMEESLKNVFKSIGELVLELKQKAVNRSPDTGKTEEIKE